MIDKLLAPFRSLEHFIGYVKARAAEKSTWAGIIGGFTGASALQHPWDYLSAACGAVMAIMPSSKKDDGDAAA